jgi:hypothetical protein
MVRIFPSGLKRARMVQNAGAGSFDHVVGLGQRQAQPAGQALAKAFPRHDGNAAFSQ